MPSDVAAEACILKAYGIVGAPAAEGSDIVEQKICRDGYALAFNLKTRVPDWVIEHVTVSQLRGPAVRRNVFRPDPILKEAGSQLADYAGSGYDRGHQAPAADFKSSQALMDDSFFLSNMAPQVGFGFNRGEWAFVEGAVRCWLRQGVVDQVFVMTGPVYGDHSKMIGSNHVFVPEAFYKIVYDPDRNRAIGFLLPNQKTENQTVANFIRPISTIEAKTELSFLSALPLHDQGVLKSNKPVMWANEDVCDSGAGGA